MGKDEDLRGSHERYMAADARFWGFLESLALHWFVSFREFGEIFEHYSVSCTKLH